MLRYHVRARDLLDLVNDIKSRKLIMSPYFQRNLVWRDVHKRDFIETILLGLPFPQIFIAQGEIDVETMTSQSCVVDGQQRMNAIVEFTRGDLRVRDKSFFELSDDQKTAFLRYQVPVIDLDIKASDPQIIDIFKRLNRTFYALSAIEKMSTEFATVDLMLIAKLCCGIIEFNPKDDEDDDDLRSHPMHPKEFDDWARGRDVSSFCEVILTKGIFSAQELARVVHLMQTLNILTTLSYGFFARNERTREVLQEGASEYPGRDKIVSSLNRAARLFLSLNLPPQSMWWSKSNSFTLLVLLAWHWQELEDKGVDRLSDELSRFSDSPPKEYVLATREGVNNRKQRADRHKMLADALGLPSEEMPLLEQ